MVRANLSWTSGASQLGGCEVCLCFLLVFSFSAIDRKSSQKCGPLSVSITIRRRRIWCDSVRRRHMEGTVGGRGVDGRQGTAAVAVDDKVWPDGRIGG